MADSHLSGTSGTSVREARAAAFVGARLSGRSLASYPGSLPATLAEAYDIQSLAIGLWPDRLSGWKVGKINPPWDASLGTDRLAGPIFSKQVTRASDRPEPVFLFAGGFGAVEGEIVLELGADAPADKFGWTLGEAAELAGAARFGVEVASSPFAEINDHGPLVTISDFGNNNGLILGDEIKSWRGELPADWRIRTLIDGVEVGTGDASVIPGGPLESFRALLEICARRGLPLRRGMLVSTGAVTGVHPIRPGQAARIEMEGLSPIDCIAHAAAVTVPVQPNPA